MAALVATIRVAGASELEVLAAELVELLSSGGKRARGEAMVATASLFARLPVQARSAAVCVARERLIAAAAELDTTDPVVRMSVAALAGATVAPALCPRLPELLLDPDPDVSKVAEQAVIELASNAQGAAPDDRAACERAVAEAIATFDRHRRRGVLLAGLRVLGSPSGLACDGVAANEWLNDASHPAHMAIRSLLRREQGPEISRAAMVWLRVPAQASACRERLLAAGTVADHEAVFGLTHLLAHPARRLESRHGARTFQDEARWSVDPETVAQLSAAARRQIPRWIEALPVDHRDDRADAALLAADPDPLVRLAAAIVTVTPDVSSLLDLAYDEDASVARSAALRLGRLVLGRSAASAVDQGVLTLSRLQRSPHAGVRAVVHAVRVDQSGPAARTAWRLSLRRDRAGALADLRDNILMGDVSTRVASIGVCRVLGVAGDLERDLSDIAEEFMSVVDGTEAESRGLVLAATAVAALGQCSGERSMQFLIRAMEAADARVAANAVESAARRARRAGPAPGVVSRLMEFKDAAAHRVRANAALALLRLVNADNDDRVGADVIVRMLSDDRTEHRLAGLWLAERATTSDEIRPMALVEHVNALRDDADEGVRARATRCRRRLGVLAGVREATA